MKDHSLTGKETTALEEIVTSLISIEGLSDLARTTGFIQRQRTLDAVQLLSSLMVCCSTTSLQWLTQLHRGYCTVSKRTISYKPFHNQLRKEELSSFLRATLLHFMNLGCQSSLVLKKKHRERFNDILIHDGFSFGLKRSLAKEFPGSLYLF
jgi:hypothetical protein